MTKEDILKGESATLEFKEQLPSNSEKYTKTVVAFANSQGGKIVVGVNDKTREIVGVESSSLFKLMDTIADTVVQVTEPMIIPDITPLSIDGKTLIVISIPAQMKRPYYLKRMGKENGTFIRVGATTRLAWPEKIKELEMEGSRISWDELPLYDYPATEESISKLCSDMNQYREAYAKERGIEGGLSKVTAKNLENWGVIKKNGENYISTNAFALLSGDYFRYSRIQCAVFAGKTRGIFIDRKEYSGPVYEQIEEAYKFVLRNIRLSAEVIDLIRHDYYEFPTRAIREMIINAVCHRNYLENGCIQVALYEDRLEVTSPGGFYLGLTLEEALNGTSKQRNKVLAEVFSEMKLVEGWGSGFSLIINGAMECGLKNPEFIESPNTFRINFFRSDVFGTEAKHNDSSDIDNKSTSESIGITSEKNELASENIGITSEKNELASEKIGTTDLKEPINLTETQIKIIEALKKFPEYTAVDLSESVGISRRNIEANIKKLKDLGILIREGSRKDGSWKVVDKE